jgi:hypothetical protein
MTSLSTHALELPTYESREDISRVDLVFYGVDHAGTSYSAHVYLDRPTATVRTRRDAAHGYAGSFTVFGHGGCFGDDGHCLPGGRTVDVFDVRPPHALTPLTKTVIATDAIAPLLADPEIAEVTLTLVIEAPGPASRRLGPATPPFSRVRLLTYGD